MKLLLPIAALFCSVLLLFLVIWIVVRAPHRIFWLISIVIGEWSLFAGVVALVGALLGILCIRSGYSIVGYLALISGASALLISLYPYLATLPIASSHGTSLSITHYFLGTSIPVSPQIQTYTFSEAEGNPLEMDVYSAVSVNKQPAVVVVHGGSWNGGNRSDFPAWNHWLVNQGYVVFDIDYRLAPQPNWQTATQDVKDAIRWIKSKADQFNIDPDRMALLGRSAGGHLALFAAYTSLADTSSASPDSRVQSVIAFYAPADLKWGYENPAKVRVNDGSAQLRAFTGGTPTTVPEVYKQASPLTYLKEDTPPTLLLHGEKDQLVGTFHSTSLHQQLQNIASNPERHQLVFIPYGQHGFDFNFNGWGSQISQHVILRHLNTSLAR